LRTLPTLQNCLASAGSVGALLALGFQSIFGGINLLFWITASAFFGDSAELVFISRAVLALCILGFQYCRAAQSHRNWSEATGRERPSPLAFDTPLVG
jgi:hypothetical protein